MPGGRCRRPVKLNDSAPMHSFCRPGRKRSGILFFPVSGSVWQKGAAAALFKAAILLPDAARRRTEGDVRCIQATGYCTAFSLSPAFQQECCTNCQTKQKHPFFYKRKGVWFAVKRLTTNGKSCFEKKDYFLSTVAICSMSIKTLLE